MIECVIRQSIRASIVLVALAAVMAAGCATGRAFARGEAAGTRRRLGSRGRFLPAGARRRSRSPRLQDRARARDAGRGGDVRRARPAVRRGRPARRGAARVPQGAGVRAVEPAVGRARRRRSSARCAIASRRRSRGPTSNGCAQQARAPHGRADPQPVQSRAADRQLRQHQHPRHPDVHRQLQRHQRHVRSRLPGSHRSR